MMNKKGVGTFGGIIISIILVMGMFYGLFEYVGFNYSQAGIESDEAYMDAYEALQTSEAELEADIEEIRDSAQEINEADGSLISVAWNGLSGLASTMRLFVGIVDVAVSVWNTLFPILTFLPAWVKILTEMAIIISIILLIVGAFTSGLKT